MEDILSLRYDGPTVDEVVVCAWINKKIQSMLCARVGGNQTVIDNSTLTIQVIPSFLGLVSKRLYLEYIFRHCLCLIEIDDDRVSEGLIGSTIVETAGTGAGSSSFDQASCSKKKVHERPHDDTKRERSEEGPYSILQRVSLVQDVRAWFKLVLCQTTVEGYMAAHPGCQCYQTPRMSSNSVC